MGSIGDCYDNSLVESFWGTMQLELLDFRIWRTRTELATAIFRVDKVLVQSVPASECYPQPTTKQSTQRPTPTTDLTPSVSGLVLQRQL
jgi:transposase InsO family protein